MNDRAQGQPGPDPAVGRPGPAARMSGPNVARPVPAVLIPPVTSPSAPSVASAPTGTTTATLAGPAPAEATPATGPASDEHVQRPDDGQPGPSASEARAPEVARSAVRRPSGPRSARLFLTHIDPWSVMKQAFLLALALAVVTLAAAAALWFSLESAGIIDAISRTATDVGGDSGQTVSGFLEFGRIMGAALIVAGIETVLVTALATLMAFMYNLSVGIGGGLEVTLSEEG